MNIVRSISAPKIALIALLALSAGAPSTGKDHAVEAGVAAAGGEQASTARIVLAQYNPCPNGQCR
jgi:hypothetical protein